MSRPDDAFESLRLLLGKHQGVVDEVAFFETVSNHLFLPLEFFREVANVLRQRIVTLKRDGIPSVGINVLTTIGHVDEGWDVFERLPFQAMVGHDGSISKGSACPNSPELRQYIADKYSLLAATGPDFIWVDDDIRMHSHGIEYGCFCSSCLAIFSNETNRTFERESLMSELNDPAGAALRHAWVEQNVRSIESLLAYIEATVHGINPEIKTGLMTAGVEWTTYSGQAFDRWFGALKSTKARPGGGFYTDERPIDMYNKAMSMARQCALLPDDASDRQYELENFPYATLGKARSTVVNECTLALAAGCNGVAFNALGIWEPDDPSFGGKEPLMQRLAEVRPFWQMLIDHADDYPLAGYWPAWTTRLLAGRTVRQDEKWLDESWFYDIRKPSALARLGLPLSADRLDNGVILAGRTVEAFCDDDLRAMLAGAVMMDAFALEALANRGLGDLCGVRVANWQDNGLAERLTADALNGSNANQLRDIRAEFWGDPFMASACLELLSPDVDVLSVLETYLGERREPCVTAFENSLGGRVVVMGHAPWRYAEVKREQILKAADWAMRERLPIRITDNVPVIPLVRLSADRRKGIIVLLNAGLDPIPMMRLEVRGPMTRVQLIAPGVKPRDAEPTDTLGGWTTRLTDIEPWQVIALCLG
ncbi:MAG: hypothetical protein O3A51_08230 [Verrucomicrobia bacterium]|nr:hypothetical protein [Verrucomicrobiota bacterium]